MRGALVLWLGLVAAGAATWPVSELSGAERHVLQAAAGDVPVREASGVLGLAGLLAPAVVVAGETGARLWLLALWAGGWVAARGLARRALPDPWATWGTLACALSPASLAAATQPAATGPAGALLAAGTLLALHVRERPGRTAAGAGALLAALAPWLAVHTAVAAALVCGAAAHWSTGLARLLALEAALLSAVVFVTVHDQLYGRLPSPAIDVWVVGALPAVLLGALGAVEVARRRRARLGVALPAVREAEAAATLGLAVALTAALLAPLAPAATLGLRLLRRARWRSATGRPS